MKGRVAAKRFVRIEDISPTMFAGYRTIRSLPNPPRRRRTALEQRVIAELLRATPKFWSGAALVVTVPEDEGPALFHIVSADPIPSWATPTERIREVVKYLRERMEEEEGVAWSRATFVAMWTSPRTWEHDSRFEYPAPQDYIDQLSLPFRD